MLVRKQGALSYPGPIQTPWENSDSRMCSATPGGGMGVQQQGESRQVPTWSLLCPHPRDLPASAQPQPTGGLCGKGERSCFLVGREISGEHRPLPSQLQCKGFAEPPVLLCPDTLNTLPLGDLRKPLPFSAHWFSVNTLQTLTSMSFLSEISRPHLGLQHQQPSSLAYL